MPAPRASPARRPSDPVAPTPPTVVDNCNRPITPSAAVVGADPACAGTKTYTFTYTDCNGTAYEWVYTYTISAPTVTMPAPGASTVACPADAVAPTPPTVVDNCKSGRTPCTEVVEAEPASAGTIKTKVA